MLTQRRTVSAGQIQKSLQRDAKNPAYVAKIEARTRQMKSQLQAQSPRSSAR